jgi:hypothetical protein
MLNRPKKAPVPGWNPNMAYSDFQPPPSRTNPTAAQNRPPPPPRSTNSSTGPNIARKYRDAFYAGKEARSQSSSKEDTSARARTYKQWEDQEREKKNAQHPPPPPPRPAEQHPNSPGFTRPVPTPPYGYYPDGDTPSFAQQSTEHSATAGHYSPYHSGDEKRQSAYASTHGRSTGSPRPQNKGPELPQRPGPFPHPTARKDPVTNLREENRSNSVDFGRVPTPYAQTPGERISLSADGLNRSASMKDMPRRTGTPAASNLYQAHEAYSTTSENSHGPNRRHSSSPLRSGSAGANRDNTSSAGASPKSSSRSPHASRPRQGFATFRESDYETSSEDDSDDMPSMNSQRKSANNATAASSSGQDRPKRVPRSRRKGSISENSQPFDQSTDRRAGPASISPMPEDLNAKFDAARWSGDFFGASKQEKSPVKRPTQSRRSSRAKSVGSIPDAPVHSTSENQPPLPPTEIPKKFEPDYWASQLKEGSFTNVAAVPPEHSPTRQSRVSSRKTRKNSKNARSDSKKNDSPIPPDNIVTISDEEDSPAEKRDDDDGSAMDLDTPPPQKSAPNRTRASSSSKESSSRPVPAIPKSPALPPRNDNATTDSSKKGFNLNAFASVEPFAPRQGQGLKDLSDLSSTLPFPSQASTETVQKSQSIEKPKRHGQDLLLPVKPRPPTRPVNMTPETWRRYLADFVVYMHHYATYTAQIVAHFAEERNSLEKSLREGGAWLCADLMNGTAGGRNGLPAYKKTLERDRIVRRAWEDTIKEHEVALRAFEAVRDEVWEAFGGS